ncbi:hypothetical protein D9Q98_001663 [Chlorella vulgaris]|uniref:Uncharacterized protein n=1 Tax=Chlorella vulgaris TaxID=3077 RepID=A0A9D4Z066_CHLVU|nr:hypothetical protein D9Q98_001663 [Chlorella vulgaris]
MVLGASLLSERLNGQGLLAQLELDNSPLLVVVVAALVAGVAWPAPRKLTTATDVVRDVTGRLAFGGLASAVGAELWANKGLLSLLEVETGVGMLSEIEAVLAASLLLVLTGPRRPAT